MDLIVLVNAVVILDSISQIVTNITIKNGVNKQSDNRCSNNRCWVGDLKWNNWGTRSCREPRAMVLTACGCNTVGQDHTTLLTLFNTIGGAFPRLCLFYKTSLLISLLSHSIQFLSSIFIYDRICHVLYDLFHTEFTIKIQKGISTIFHKI